MLLFTPHAHFFCVMWCRTLVFLFCQIYIPSCTRSIILLYTSILFSLLRSLINEVISAHLFLTPVMANVLTLFFGMINCKSVHSFFHHILLSPHIWHSPKCSHLKYLNSLICLFNILPKTQVVTKTKVFHHS